MNKILKPIAAALLLSAAPTTFAQSTFDAEGKYEQIKPAQQTESKGKVEVVDIFWYGCPHCFDFLPVMEAFEKNKPEYVEIRRMPAIFRKSWEPHARAYYTANVLGVTDKIHRALFEAIHKENKKMETTDELRALFESHGVSAKDFDETFNSFAVDGLVRKSQQMQQAYGVRGTPAVVINGKYRTSGSQAGSYQNVVKVIEALAEQEKAL